MRCWQFGLFLLFSLVSLDVWAQDLPDIERLLEGNDILNTEDGYEEMVDILSNLLMTPVNVNTAGFDSLKMLFLLSDSQIDQLLEFRKKYGNFLHINELLLVPGIGKKDLENIRSFITLGHPEVQDRVKAIRLRSRQELLTRAKVSLPLQEGYTTYSPVDFDTRKEYERKVDNRFHGPPVGLLLKYKATIGQHLQAGLTLEMGRAPSALSTPQFLPEISRDRRQISVRRLAEDAIEHHPHISQGTDSFPCFRCVLPTQLKFCNVLHFAIAK